MCAYITALPLSNRNGELAAFMLAGISRAMADARAKKGGLDGGVAASP
jgi:hypothetical protein